MPGSPPLFTVTYTVFLAAVLGRLSGFTGYEDRHFRGPWSEINILYFSLGLSVQLIKPNNISPIQ